jgi:GT2 family glycosyltransferase
MPEQKLISVVISNYNKKDCLRECLESVFKQTYPKIEVIVIDNGSEDGSCELIDKYDAVKVIRNRKNELFSKSQNMGIRASRGEYVLCLNNDVVLKEDFIEKLISKASFNNEMIGIFTGRVLSSDGRKIDSCGQLLSRSRKPIERGYGRREIELYQKREVVFGACGVAGMFKRDMLDEISINEEYFDEDFAIFFEDLDLNWRANNFGWKALYIPDAVCFHRRGTTTIFKIQVPLLKNFILPNIPHKLQAYFIRNRYLAVIKNDSIKKILFDLPFIVIYEIKIWLFVILFRPILFGSIFSYVYYFKRAFRKRKAIKNMLKYPK